MTTGIVGLGLIGGSLAKSYKADGHSVIGCDTAKAVMNSAQQMGVIDAVLDERSIRRCDLIFIAVNPGAAVAWLEQNAAHIANSTVVIDCCGVKRSVCARCFALAGMHGFTFVGGHPMAGSHKAGFSHSRADLFRGASMVLVPPEHDNAALLEHVEQLLKPADFERLTVTTAEKHDEMIAFSSQMAHVVSNAYIKNPSAREHEGFSAGSYKDLTRVAQLNAAMWTELCLDNSDKLIRELDFFLASVQAYRNALAAKNQDELLALFEEGSNLKKELDKE